MYVHLEAYSVNCHLSTSIYYGPAKILRTNQIIIISGNFVFIFLLLLQAIKILKQLHAYQKTV